MAREVRWKAQSDEHALSVAIWPHNQRFEWRREVFFDSSIEEEALASLSIKDKSRNVRAFVMFERYTQFVERRILLKESTLDIFANRGTTFFPQLD